MSVAGRIAPARGPRVRLSDPMLNAALIAPAVAVIAAIVIAPTLWMFAQSFLHDGQLSLHHYERVLTGRLHRIVIRQTFELALYVTLICTAVGVPYAWLTSRTQGALRALLIACVAVPFFASLLVRTYAWLVLLQGGGVVNQMLIWVGVIAEPLQLVHNRTGAMIGMVHIMLPFFIFPAYAAFAAIPTDLVRAARGLGASPLRAFMTAVLPMAVPGVVTGMIFVFVLSLGFYVTPALLGGGRMMTAPMLLARDLSRIAEWGAASALGVVLFLATVGLAGLAYLVLGRRALGPGGR